MVSLQGGWDLHYSLKPACFFPENACEVVVEANAFNDPLAFLTGGFGGSSLESGASFSQE